MRTLVWSSAFARALKKAIRRNSNLADMAEQTLTLLADDPFHPSLHTHKLKGVLEGTWACTVDYNYRIIFEFIQNDATGKEEIFLLTVGVHDEVY